MTKTYAKQAIAKWSATLYTNLSEKFGRHLFTPDDEYVARMEKAYPHIGERV